VLVGILAVAGLGVAATWPGFDPKQISVSGNHRVAGVQILQRAAIAPHVTIWLQNTGAMRRRIEAIPYIATASVHRVPPASIAIAVSERVPYALVRSDEDEALVDHAMRVLEPATLDATLPVLVLRPGLDLTPGTFIKSRDAVALRAADDAMGARQIVPAQLEFDRYGGLVVTLHSGLRLLLGSDNDLGQKLTLAGAIISQVVGKRQHVSAIDLRAPGTPVLVYR